MKKRILSILLAAVMLLLVTTTAFARNCETVTITNTTLWDDGSLKSMDVTFNWGPSGNEHLYIAVLGEHSESNSDGSEYWFQYDHYSHTDPDSIASSIADFAGYRGIEWYSYGGDGSTPENGNNTITVSFDKGTVPLNVDRNYCFVMFNAPDGTNYRPTDPLGKLKCASSALSFENTSGGSTDVTIDAYDVTNGAPESAKETNHGYLTIDKTSAKKDDTVTVTVNPAKGYQLKSMTVMSTVSMAPPVIPTQDTQNKTKYTFKMPEHPSVVKAEFEEAPEHTHAFTYTANGNKITATCTSGCDGDYDTAPLTLTLTPPSSLVYDGNPKGFTFAADEAAAWMGAGLELPTIYYSVKQSGQSSYMPLLGTLKNVGNYMAQITVDGKTAQTEFSITEPHTHNPVKVNGQAATKEAAGWKDYYECDCGALFEDENGTKPIENLNAWKAQGGNGYIAKLDDPTSPQTGDTADTVLWISLAALSFAGLCACLVLGKKKKNV